MTKGARNFASPGTWQAPALSLALAGTRIFLRARLEHGETRLKALARQQCNLEAPSTNAPPICART